MGDRGGVFDYSSYGDWVYFCLVWLGGGGREQEELVSQHLGVLHRLGFLLRVGSRSHLGFGGGGSFARACATKRL